MHHYLYIVTHKDSSKFYVGRHSTKDLLDGYHGSGNWVKSIKDQTLLNTIIVCFCKDQEELKLVEQLAITSVFDHPDCMNFSNVSSGFSTGALNPSMKAENRQKRSILMSNRNLESFANGTNPLQDPKNIQKRIEAIKSSEKMKNRWKDPKNLEKLKGPKPKHECPNCGRMVCKSNMQRHLNGSNCNKY